MNDTDNLEEVDLRILTDEQLLALYRKIRNRQFKAAAHLLRLLEMGCEFLETGVLNVWREDAMLLAVKRGEWRLAEVQARAALLFGRAEKALAASPLPDAVDTGRVNELCVAVVERRQEFPK